MKIEDNFLDQEKFDELQTLIMGKTFFWFYADVIDYKGQKDKFQFTHMFQDVNMRMRRKNIFGRPTSAFYQILTPILNKVNLLALWRIKANLLTRTPNIVENEFHFDIGGIPEEKLKQWTTSIFYVNTNNGWTEFEDGTKVESVANRMITFPSNMKHRGTSCTDEKTRVVINFNYFK